MENIPSYLAKDVCETKSLNYHRCGRRRCPVRVNEHMTGIILTVDRSDEQSIIPK